MSSVKDLLDDLSEALGFVADLSDAQLRLKAYKDAGVDLTPYTIDTIRDADRLAVNTEMGRRISRSN